MGLSRRLLGFTLLPLISIATPLLALPIVARNSSTAEWVGLAVGQALGVTCAIVVGQGWGLRGPALIASVLHEPDWIETAIVDSFKSRLMAFIVASPVVAAIAGFLAPAGGSVMATLSALAFSTYGFTLSWVFVGLGDPWGAAKVDHLPKAVANIVGAVLVWWGMNISCYPIVIGSTMLFAGPVCTYRRVRMAARQGLRAQSHARLFKTSWKACATELVSSYGTLGTPLFASSPSVTAISASRYVSADRLNIMGQYAVGALANALQRWVVEGDWAVRFRRALIFHGLLGVVGLLIFIFFAPLLSALLFTESFAFDALVGAGFGSSILIVSLNTTLRRHLLLPRERDGLAFLGSLAGAAVGLPLVFLCGQLNSLSGAAFSLAFGQFVTLIIYGAPLVRAGR